MSSLLFWAAPTDPLSNWPGESCASDCSAYLAGILRSLFIISLMSMKHVLAATKTTSGTLQGPFLELPQAVERIKNLSILFQQWKTVKPLVAIKRSMMSRPLNSYISLPSFPSDCTAAFHRLRTVRLAGKVFSSCRVLLQSVPASSSMNFRQKCH